MASATPIGHWHMATHHLDSRHWHRKWASSVSAKREVVAKRVMRPLNSRWASGRLWPTACSSFSSLFSLYFVGRVLRKEIEKKAFSSSPLQFAAQSCSTRSLGVNYNVCTLWGLAQRQNAQSMSPELVRDSKYLISLFRYYAFAIKRSNE